MIKNIRLNTFATNSSSTHSIIITSNENPLYDYIPDQLGSFGWDQFVLVSDHSKRAYIATILANNLSPFIGETFSRQVASKLLKVAEQYIDYVDHQSLIRLPRCFQGGLNFEFFNDYKNYLLKKSVAILGGNDNDDSIRMIDSFSLPLFYDTHSEIIARKDKRGFWTLFDQYNGTKIRVDFREEKGKSSDCLKATYPELIDIKITDYCPFACSYCYMGSSNKGEPGNKDYINSLLYTLADYEIFEVALGGGEPTTHPEFIRFLAFCKQHGITANFTTKSMDWMGSIGNAHTILTSCGSFAYSVRNVSELEKFIIIFEKLKLDLKQFNFCPKTPNIHIVEYITPEYQLREILKLCAVHHYPIVLLGLKTTGRGEQYQKKQEKRYDWVSVVKKLIQAGDYIRFGIDTCIAQKYENEINELGVSNSFYTKKEGAFSCYVDGVQQKIGPSSFADPDEFKEFPISQFKNLEKYFNAF